jgi:hypothetical protein
MDCFRVSAPGPCFAPCRRASTGCRGVKVAFQSRGLDTPRDYKVTLQALSRDLKVGLEENVKVITTLIRSSSLGTPAT